MKITSSLYRLPYVMAISGHEQLQNSANKPVIMTGIDMDTGERADYVVKLNASERMHKEARLRELLAAFIAMEMELPVVEPAIINISPEFVKTLTGKPYYSIANNSLGLNVGSKYIRDYPILANEISLTPHQEIAAQHVFGFDLLIQNVDRNFEKPNMITNGNDLVMLDHELGFTFLLVPAFLRSGKAWEFDDTELTWIKKHCLFKRLKGKIYELDNFALKLLNLNDDFWKKAFELIPNEWMIEDICQNIKTHVNLLLEHRDEFINNIKLILS